MSDYEEFNLDAFAKPKPRAVDTLEQQEHFISEHDLDEKEDLNNFSPSEREQVLYAINWITNATALIKVRIVKKFTDDHERCYDVVVVNQNNDELGISFWWCGHVSCNSNFSTTLEASEKGDKKSKQYLLEYLKDLIDL